MRLISGAKQGTGELRDRSCLVKCSARAKTLLQNLHWYEGGVVCCWGGSFICAIATAVSLCLRSFGPIVFSYRGFSLMRWSSPFRRSKLLKERMNCPPTGTQKQQIRTLEREKNKKNKCRTIRSLNRGHSGI